MKTVLPLRVALAANAAFSLSTALMMLVSPALVGELLGIQSPLILQLIGMGLVIFSAELIFQATRQRVATWRALLASGADFLWVAGSIVFLLAFPHLLSPLGNVLVHVVASIVCGFACWQLWAVGHAHKAGAPGVYRHCLMVDTNAPPEDLWQVVGNIGDIHHYLPSLRSSVILDGRSPGVGAVRACEDRGGKRWSEECTEFHVGESFSVRFLAEAPDFPFPAKTMRGGWKVAPSRAGSQVTIWWELTLKNNLLAPVVLPVLAYQVDRDFPKIVQRMAAAALGRPDDAGNRTKTGVLARLVPSIC